MKIYALGTHSDWVYNGGAWGRPGHQRIADLTYAAGIRRLYWRTHNGGQALYPSKVCKVEDGEIFRDPTFKGLGTLPKSYFAYAQYLDYRQWDQVADMVEIGTAVGLEVCHWYTVFEDDHGGHLASDFLLAHPEYRCVLKSGEPIPGCLDFWYPEVRAYKLAILSELLDRPTQRILLDFLRRNGIPSADAAGNFRYGFNPEIVAGFRKETGLDAKKIEPGTADWEAWLDYNAQPLTDFLREAQSLVASKNGSIDLLTWAVDTRRWQALDIAYAAKERLFENLLTGTHRYAYSAADAKRQVTSMRKVLGKVSTPVLPGLFAYSQIPPKSVDEFADEARDLNCPAFVLHEANHVIECPISDRLRARYFGKPHSAREVEATPLGTPPKIYRNFIKAYEVEDVISNQVTEFSASHTPDALKIVVTCHERNPSVLLPVPKMDMNNYNVKELGARVFWSPFESVHLLIDPEHDHEDYYHFVLDPSGAQLMERRLDEDWRGDWNSEVKIETDYWTATFLLPWKTLGIVPETHRLMGFQLVRIQDSPREVSAWFCTMGRRVNPLDFGHLILCD